MSRPSCHPAASASRSYRRMTPTSPKTHRRVAADGGLIVCGRIDHQAVVAPVVHQVPG